MRSPFIIAEFASSHDGVFDHMLDGIAVAKRAGADAFKTQFMSSPERVAERMHAPEAVETYRKYQWPAAWLPLLSKTAHDAGLEFLCTVDLPEDIAVVAPHVDRFKIASFGATDKEFIEAHAKYGKPVIISTGLCDAEEALWLIGPPWGFEASWDILHCVSAYPTPLEEANLSAIREIALDGWSDHTANPLTGAFAVCAGARILETHFRLDTTEPTNPDYRVSHSPAGLTNYVWLARQAAKALGDGVKRVMPSEASMVKHRYV